MESYVRDLVAVVDDGRLHTLLSEHQPRRVAAYVERGLEAGDPTC
jgi:hypothetical protein